MAIHQTVIKKSKTGFEVSVETPSTADAAELLDTARRIMSESKHLLTTGDEFKFTVEMQEKRIRELIEHPDALLLVAKVDGKIVGMADFKVGSRRRTAHQGMLGLSFLPEFTGKGLGPLLMNELIDWAGSNPRIEALRLHVHAKNSGAISLYERLGFRIEGREVRGIKLEDGSYDDVLMMALFL